MVYLNATSANIRLMSDDGVSVCSINNIAPNVTAETVAGFVNAIERIYNNGSCAARISVVYDLHR